MKTKQGFTLIELLIAMGIFAVFITIITGVFTNFIKVQRHAIAQGQLISDTRSAMEAFIKEARTGYGSTYNSNGSEIAFRNQNRECVAFRKNADVLERGSRNTTDECVPGSVLDNRFTPITSKATRITVLTFNSVPAVVSNNGALQKQGVISITLEATSKKDGIPPITIQNSVTSRQMEPL